MDEGPNRHRCPWPGCYRNVLPWFWGCAPHWMMVPMELRDEFLNTRRREATTQPVDHQMAVERIRNWLTENAHPDALRESRATRDLAPDEFVAGVAGDGEVVLFWPRAGEYLILGQGEISVLRRLLLRTA